MIDENIFDDRTAVHKEVQFFLTFLAGVMHLEDPLAEMFPGQQISLSRRGDINPFSAQDCDICDDDLSADGQHASKS